MSIASFQTQVSQFLIEHPAPCNRDVIIEDSMSLMVTKWKDLWIKTPEKDEWEDARNGYLKAYALGYIDDLWIEGVEIITSHVEGIPVNKSHIPLLKSLLAQMVKDCFFLYDWHPGNILVTNEGNLKVIDWGYSVDNQELAEWKFKEFLRDELK
ncbi:MAG: AarF/UbiB family protein [Planktothrix sp.]